MATASTRERPQRFVLYSVSYRAYLRLLRAFDERGLRITFDRGALEIMTLTSEHEHFKCLLGYLIAALVEELGLNMGSYGSMTYKRRAKQRGLEPDQCYWIQNESQVRCRDHVDIRTVPPPDLVVEIEVTRSALDRLGIYAAFGVPEIWRFDGEKLRVMLLGVSGTYDETDKSAAFPMVPLNELMRFLGLRTSLSETDVVRQFRTWVRDRSAAGWK